jgi:hypothetical protein
LPEFRAPAIFEYKYEHDVNNFGEVFVSSSSLLSSDQNPKEKNPPQVESSICMHFTMGSVGTLVVETTVSLPEAAQSPVTTLYRHDCANAGNYGLECPPRWSKFASHEDDQAHLTDSIKLDPIIHRHFFNKDDKKCLCSHPITNPKSHKLSRIQTGRWLCLGMMNPNAVNIPVLTGIMKG